MKEARCSDVQIEPPLLPVNPNDFHARTKTTDGARLDISARGLQSAFERTFFDVRTKGVSSICRIKCYCQSSCTICKEREGKK